MQLEKRVEAEVNDRLALDRRLSERATAQAAQIDTKQEAEAARVTRQEVTGRLADCEAQLIGCVAHRPLIVALRGEFPG